jgi:hypothetical protein
MNGQRLSALYDTGADVCCISSKAFRRVFRVRQKPEKLNQTSSVSTFSGNTLEGMESIQFFWKLTKENSPTIFISSPT